MPVAAETLIEAAWPTDRPEGVTRSLHVRLAGLRALLDPAREPGCAARVLVRDPAGYRLAVAPESVDAHRFECLAGEAARLPPLDALPACDEALALWRGEPFADLALADDAAAVEARRLHAIRDRLRRTRATALGALGRADEACAELAALVAEDPLREELVAELMSCRYAAGRHAEALDAYRELAARLAEVGLRPGPQVRELEAMILRHADGLPRTGGTPPSPTNVGARVASVVGRDGDLAALAAVLREHRIVTLVGPAGVGKTTLAAETARALLDRTPDGTWLVDLGPLRAADEVLPAVGTALGIRRVGTGGDDGDRDALGVLRERLRGARLLVVLDGAEHLVPELGPIAHDLAATGPGVGVLVTSRRPLGVAGEAVVPVRPLDAGTAAALFMERARAARPDWVADPAESDAVTHICRRIDGLPLAVELAAARLRALSAAAIAERLERGLGVLGRGGTLEASIEASHALLTPDEQELFRRLSVFAGPFHLDDAEQVGGGDGLDRDAVLDLLVALDRALDGPGRGRVAAALPDARGAARPRPRAPRRRRAGRRRAPPRHPLRAALRRDRLRGRSRGGRGGRRPAGAVPLGHRRGVRMGGRARRDGPRARPRDGPGRLPSPRRDGDARPRADRGGARAWRRGPGPADPGDAVADRAAAVRAAPPGGRGGDRAGARADRVPRDPPRAERAARVRGPARALPGRPRRRRTGERGRVRAGPPARRAPHRGLRGVDAGHGRAHARPSGRRGRALRRRVRARDRPGRHLRARQPGGGARRGRRSPPGARTRRRRHAPGRWRRLPSARSASATRSCCTRRRSWPRAAATSSARPCSPAPR